MFTWIVILLAVIFILITISVIIYFMQDSMVFHAEKLPVDYEFSFNSDFDEINLPTQDGKNLNGILFKVSKPKGVILLFHNHSGNILHWSKSANVFNTLNHDVLMMDYRGFGKSTGNFNEKLMKSDTLLWYSFTKKLYNENLITIYGRGIGSFFATYVSALNNPKRLILESAVYNIYHTVKYHYPYLPYKLILRYKFETVNYINKVSCPIYFFHGKKNELVHYTNSVKLYEMNESNNELILIDDGNHYNVTNNPIFLDRIKGILRN